MSFPSELIERAKSKFAAARSLPELERAMAEFVSDLGFAHGVYYFPAWPWEPDSRPVFLRTYPQAWVDYYLDCKYNEIDPVITQGFQTTQQIDWSKLHRESPKVRTLFAEAKENGIGSQGLVSAIRGPRQDAAIFTVTSNASDRDWGRLDQAIVGFLQIIGQAIHARVMTLIAPQLEGGSVHLTPREVECLLGHARGFKYPRLGAMLGIQADTVRGHLANACRKLGAASPGNAVACAIFRGILSSEVFSVDPRGFVGSRRPG
jgi:LuxR family transcriptional activator of bioluminescence operon